MPERNLVSRNRTAFWICVFSWVLVGLQTGCKNLGKSSADRELFPLVSQRYSDPSEEIAESESLYVAPSGSEETGNHRPRFLNGSNETTAKLPQWDSPVQFPAPAPSIAASSTGSGASSSLSDQACNHHENCDCYKDRLPAGLPYAEPTEPPRDARLATPMGTATVNQPLTPIPLAPMATQVEVSEKRVFNPSSEKQVIESSVEKTVAVNVRPAMTSPVANPVATAARPVGFSKLSTIVVGPVDLGESKRESTSETKDESAELITADAQRQHAMRPICDWCQSTNCDGACKINSRRSGLTDSTPVMESTPEAVALAPSLPDASPSARSTPDSGGDFQPLPFQEAASSPTIEIAQQEKEIGIDELRREAWQMMIDDLPSVPTDVVQTPQQSACAICGSSYCNDPNCGQSKSPQAFAIDTTSGGDFQAPPQEVPSNEFNASKIPADLETEDAGGVEVAGFASPDGSHSFDDSPTVDNAPEPVSEFQLSNAVFCTEVSGFSQFKPFASTTFRPGQNLLIYCEVENQYSEEQPIDSDVKFMTRLQGNYAIVDSQGHAVAQVKFPMVKDVARKRRRDFYMYFPIQLGELVAGDYRVELTVKDLGNQQTDSITTGLEFRVE